MDTLDEYIIKKMYYHGSTVREIKDELHLSLARINRFIYKEVAAGRLCRVWDELTGKRNLHKMTMTDLKTGAYESHLDHYIRRHNDEDVVVIRVSEYLRLLQNDGLKLDVPQLTTPAHGE